MFILTCFDCKSAKSYKTLRNAEKALKAAKKKHPNKHFAIIEIKE